MTDVPPIRASLFLRRLPDRLQLALIWGLILVPLVDLVVMVESGAHPGGVGMGLLVSLVLFGFYLAASWVRASRRAMTMVTQAMQAVVQGHYDTRLPVTGQDGRWALAVAFNDMVRSVERRMTQTSGVLDEVAHAVGELQASAKRVDDAAAHQRDAATSTAAAMEEMTVSLGEVAEQTQDTERRAADASDLAKSGSKTLNDTTRGLVGLAGTIKIMSQDMQQLKERSSEISAVSQLIRSIAEQTNLLALNAAIEAARAGEHGRGFAVVADEVRSLALRSHSSAETISRIIDAIQDDIHHAVDRMGAASTEADANVTHVNEVVTSLENIHKRVHAALDSVEQIGLNTRQQREVSAEIARHVEEISGNAWENSAAAHETSEVADYLDQLARRLRLAQTGMTETGSA
ncbi:hypothetical protein A9404_06265 [Halothiobacillus diazotrophicus]|uniref:Chemotaxis protein n=1 Tax=Halothiobacillus diazotrophicus TaxID=1860122 RepID=A0A191ZGQ4_9GAMM|nr:HAMP domain-containing methyl-accepting chemotaxis protein [Halothiobacillus diazotrophicus]ANJ67038.1 hypothetical protein A9404_06265 [Halothiobacillus diazotrophicus]